MGYSLSWLAVKGRPAQAVREELGFRTTGQREEFAESDLSAVELPTGWYLIVSNRMEQVSSNLAMQRLSSAGCQLVTCFLEEHVMFSMAAGWSDGRRCWSVCHDVTRGMNDLTTEGDLPPEFGGIRDRLLSKQREEDERKDPRHRPLFRKRGVPVEEMRCDYIFSIPVDLAENMTGYRHDRDIPGLTGMCFEVLRDLKPEQTGNRPSLWKRFFGTQKNP